MRLTNAEVFTILVGLEARITQAREKQTQYTGAVQKYWRDVEIEVRALDKKLDSIRLAPAVELTEVPNEE